MLPQAFVRHFLSQQEVRSTRRLSREFGVRRRLSSLPGRVLALSLPRAGAKARGSGDANTRGPRAAGEEPAARLLGVRSPECACSLVVHPQLQISGIAALLPQLPRGSCLKEDPSQKTFSSPTSVHAQVPQNSAKTSLGSFSDF